MNYYYLEITRGIEAGKKYLLTDGGISIGRSSQNSIAINSAEKSVSGHHAIFYKTADRILLQDMESTNGTFVNNLAIKEHQLQPGDEIGLGKSGPRLKLIVSDKELDTTPPKANQFVPSQPTGLRTKEDDMRLFEKEPENFTVKENLETITRIKLNAKPTPPPEGEASQTMEFEKKILHKKMGASDMHDLMKDPKRLNKLIGRGNLGETQVSMLRTMHGAHNKLQRQWVIILCVVLFVSVTAIAFFAIRAYQYKALVNKGLTLKATLDSYEERISQANKNPEGNKRELDSLINALDKAKLALADVKGTIHESDFGKFYSDPMEKTIDEVLMRFGETNYHIPREMVDRVKYHISVYSGPLHNTIAKYISRKEKYFSMIRRIFKENNLPEDLAYVSMLESGFNPRALSHAGARGMWQFMPETGRRYGLKVQEPLDERLDPEKASMAAAKYFRELIGIFGGRSSVMLAMAAYNAGEGRIVGALRKIDNPMRNRDFWYIYRMGYLAEETNEYIPRVISLLIISEHPQQYNFAGLPSTPAEQIDSENDFIPLDDIKNKPPEHY
jgi:Soluble lytic murein transglycosylase and related regulatory proteins (some contain LysM/invasin domains)